MKIFKVSAFFALFLCVLSISAFSQKMKAEDVLAKHLDSIGTAAVRAADKTRILVGDADVVFVSPKSLPTKGRIVLASAGQKNFTGLSLNSLDYPSEKFSFDGSKTKVGYVRIGVRSVLGNFVASNNILLNESLLGGTLNTSWTLLDMPNKKVKLNYEGTKKIDGRETYALGYAAKSDLNITLYFDMETFHHVRSEYKRTSSAGIGRNPEQSSRLNESRFKITEDFSDFKNEGGLTLPHKYRLNYSVTGQNGTTEIEWNFVFSEFAFNKSLADGTFDAEAGS